MKIAMIVLCLVFVLHLSATIINIPANQPTIQLGIIVAVEGDTILVQPGSYFENINYYGKNITVTSLYLTTQDTSYISQTIIDGNFPGSVVTFENNESNTAVLTGFSIIDGSGTFVNDTSLGGGLYIINNSNPILDNLIISDNHAENGGGIWCSDSSPIFSNLTIKNNNAYNATGGGILISNSSAIFTNVDISNNYAFTLGGGLHCNFSNLVFSNTKITSNIAELGGGISLYQNNDLVLENLLIQNNFASVNGGGIWCRESTPVLKNTTISNNTASEDGGGLYIFLGSPLFDEVDRSNIYSNSAAIGNDIYSEVMVEVIVDTFTVMNPTPYHAYPIDNFTFEISNSVNIDNFLIPQEQSKIINYPNPFNPSTTIEFSIQNDSQIKITVYNVKGQKIKTLTFNEYAQGSHSITWNGDDEFGKTVSSGIYYYKLNVNGKTEAVKKCLLLK